MRRNKIMKNVAQTVAAAIALLAVSFTLSHVSSNRAAGPPASTPQQVAQALVGTGVQNSITGQDRHETVKAATPDGPFNPAPGGGRQFRCTVTLSHGETVTAEVTLWDDGSIGWHQVP